jgi:superoxide dismutase, Fe-Mn family
MKRSTFLKSSLALGVFAKDSFGSQNNLVKAENSQASNLLHSNSHSLPPLAYNYNDLEPYFDQQTMEIHHSRHHKAYVDNLNKALTGTVFEKQTLAQMFANAPKLPAAIRNNAGGHWNHSFFWESLWPKPPLPGVDEVIDSRLADKINAAFGSFGKFKEEFAKAATGRFGSGWTWLVLKNGKLTIGSTPNQDNPLMKGAEITGTPILGLDVWEHAYYLKYQNKRADYIKAFWEIVSWTKVTERLLNSER